MITWPKGELRKIADADDLHISPFREHGKTYGTPTWIWSVVVDDALYVRGYNGQNSRWYQAAVRQKAGRITVAEMTKEVRFEPVNGPINDLIDDAYRAKYKASPYLKPMIGARARSATVKLMPHATKHEPMEGAEMKLFGATLISLFLFASAASQAQTGAAQAGGSPTASAQDPHSITITRSGSPQPSKGSADHFTGSVQ